MPAALEEAPPLPAGSIDFNALHDACKAGKSAEEALIACGAKKAPDEAVAPAEEADAAPVAAGKK